MKSLLPFWLLCLFCISLHAAETAITPRDWTVDGVKREALLYIPPQATKETTPVIFAFHGHGGNMRNAVRTFPFPALWPEALVVYMQGLNTPGRLTDPAGKKPGWQHGLGDQNDRDLKFFDAVLASLRADYKVDARRIYSTGHSNGGGFTYLLWGARGEVFAAMAPSASAASKTLPLLKPKPVMHIAGENDPLVKFVWQKATIDALIRLNECGKGRAWDQDENCTLYPSATGHPVVTALHPGGHEYRKDTPPLMVKFFKQHAKGAAAEAP
jgi:polyhydroxybutyrate depolymerase